MPTLAYTKQTIDFCRLYFHATHTTLFHAAVTTLEITMYKACLPPTNGTQLSVKLRASEGEEWRVHVGAACMGTLRNGPHILITKISHSRSNCHLKLIFEIYL